MLFLFNQVFSNKKNIFLHDSIIRLFTYSLNIYHLWSGLDTEWKEKFEELVKTKTKNTTREDDGGWNQTCKKEANQSINHVAET